MISSAIILLADEGSRAAFLVVEGGLSNSSFLGLYLDLGVGFDFGFGVVGPFPSASASTSASSLGFLSIIISLVSLAQDEDVRDRSRLMGPDETFVTCFLGGRTADCAVRDASFVFCHFIDVMLFKLTRVQREQSS